MGALNQLFDVEAWKSDGKCWGKTTGPENDFWFPEDDDPDRKRKITYAKAICTVCPVKQECLEYAIRHEDSFGVWGGKTPRERSLWKRKNMRG